MKFKDIVLRIAKDKYKRSPGAEAEILINVLSEALDEYIGERFEKYNEHIKRVCRK